MKKEFVFSAKFDTAEFDRSVEQMQRKLKDIYAPVDMMRMQQNTGSRLQGMGQGGMSQPSMEAFQRATQQSRREFDQLIAEQARGQEKLGKMIVQRSDMLKKLQQQQKEMVKDSQAELEIKEKIARVEQNNQQLRETYRQRDASLNQAMDARQSMNPQGIQRLAQAYNGGGVGGMARAGFRMAGGWGGVAGAAGMAMGAVGSALERGSDFYRDISRAPLRTESSMGSAVQGTLGRDAQNIYGRRTAFEQMFQPERQRAAQQSLDMLQANKNADRMGLGGALLGAAGKGVGGAIAGAGIGSLFAGVGAVPGAIIGGVGGFGKGLMDIMGNERQRSMALSPFSSTQNKRYQSILAEETAKDYESSYEAQKKQNPFKTAAVGEYEQNYQRNLDSQRSMGLRNDQFYGAGGFMQSNINAGFTPEMGLGMSSSILGAGGSTRMARDSVFGNQLQRGGDLTNAGQVLGTLSGSMGDSASTKAATISILAEGMKLGLDDSKFAEENRRFTQAAADIVAKSGARSESDVDRVSGGFGRFLGENTNQGIGAAKTAYDQYQQISQTTTGPRGVMRAAGFLSDPSLNKMSTMTKQALMQVPESDLNEDNPLVQAAAQEAGISAKEVVSKVTSTNQGSVSRFKGADQLRDKLRSYAKSQGKDRLSEEDIKKAPKAVQDDFNKLTTYQTTELGYQGQKETVARALGTINPATGDKDVTGVRKGLVNEKLAGDSGRMEDGTIKAMAADSKVVLDNFNEMAPAMRKAAESAALWTREVREMNAALMTALEGARTGKDARSLQTLQDVLNKMANPGAQNQSQAGKQSQ